MKRLRTSRPPILERRRLKRGVKEAEAAREMERERAKAQRKLEKKHVLVNPENLAPNRSYGTPDFVRRGYYLDLQFNCKSCGAAQVWTETQQKWWYEAAKGDVWAVAVLCRPCRRKEQARRAAAREVHFAGLAAKGKNAA
jgi:Probable zinc-ribbon domain